MQAIQEGEVAASEKRQPALVSDVTLLRAIAQFVDQHHGIPPTLRELGEMVDLRSKSTVRYRLEKLVARGLCYAIDRQPAARSVTISPEGRAWLERRTHDGNA